MKKEIANKYFQEIKTAWEPLNNFGLKIIPFCTPIMSFPKAIIIGTNHSDFVEGGGPEAEKIARNFERELPLINTYIDHNHTFAKGLRRVFELADIGMDNNFVGTNRCALQTGPGGINALQNSINFINCQIRMDIILKTFIDEIKPKNIILAGKYATGLYYNKDLTFEKIEPISIELEYLNQNYNLIPIPHPSRAAFWEEAADRLRKNFIQ